MHTSLARLENIDPRFLDPDTSFVVMPEDTESALHDAHLAIDGLAWVFQSVAEANCKLRNAGANTMLLELPPEGLAALMRMVAEQIKPATNNPSLGTVRDVRPDLFSRGAV